MRYTVPMPESENTKWAARCRSAAVEELRYCAGGVAERGMPPFFLGEPSSPLLVLPPAADNASSFECSLAAADSAGECFAHAVKVGTSKGGFIVIAGKVKYSISLVFRWPKTTLCAQFPDSPIEFPNILKREFFVSH